MKTINVKSEIWESTFQDCDYLSIGFKANVDWSVHPDKPGYIVENIEVQLLNPTDESESGIEESLRELITEFFHTKSLEYNCKFIVKRA